VPFWTAYFRTAGITCPEWLTESDSNAHKQELESLAGAAAKKATIAAFQLLFRDHEFLFEFQKCIQLTIEEPSREIHSPPPNIRRARRLPKWLERAVFHRDMGHCQLCGKDVTAEVFPHGKYHLDHLLPLSKGGTNDSTNFQLLCAECNLRKGSRTSKPTNRQVLFWTHD